MSEELVIRPISKGLSRTIGEYTGILEDVEFLLSRSGERVCEGCGVIFPYCPPTEFIERLPVSDQSVFDVDLVVRASDNVLEDIIRRGFVRGRINSEEVRFEEWSGEAIKKLAVTVDRVKSLDLKSRVLAAFTAANNLNAVEIDIVDAKSGAILIGSVLGAICPCCSAETLVPTSSGITPRSFRDATFNQASVLMREIGVPDRHPDSIIFKDLQCRLVRACELGLGGFSLNSRLDELAGGERYRLVLATRVFAEVVGLEYELKDPGVTFVADDAKRVAAHIQFLRKECEVEASQLEVCLAPAVVIEKPLSITVLGKCAENFPLGEDLPAGLGAVNNLIGLSGAGKTKLLSADIQGFKRIVRLGALDGGVFKSRTVGALLGLAKPLKEFYANHPQSKVLGLKLSSFSGLLPGEKSRSTVREYELVSSVKFKKLSYDQTLRANVAELLSCFRHFPRLGMRLRLLSELGLDFVKPIDRVRDFIPPTRRLLRLVEAITSTPAEGTLFILDDMLAGISPDQLRRVVNQLQLLCERGATVITTNLDSANC